jgi:hypothetical protein
MYCQTCGAEIQPGLNYCNRCGASVNSPATQEVLVPVDLTSPVRWISVTVGVTFIIGFISIFFAIAGIASWGFNKDAVVFIALFGMMTLLGVELSLIRMLSRMLGVGRESRAHRMLKKRMKADELGAAAQSPRFIQPAAAYVEPPSSVTDHTTRTFSAAYREPRQ